MRKKNLIIANKFINFLLQRIEEVGSVGTVHLGMVKLER